MTDPVHVCFCFLPRPYLTSPSSPLEDPSTHLAFSIHATAPFLRPETCLRFPPMTRCVYLSTFRPTRYLPPLVNALAFLQGGTKDPRDNDPHPKVPEQSLHVASSDAPKGRFVKRPHLFAFENVAAMAGGDVSHARGRRHGGRTKGAVRWSHGTHLEAKVVFEVQRSFQAPHHWTIRGTFLGQVLRVEITS